MEQVKNFTDIPSHEKMTVFDVIVSREARRTRISISRTRRSAFGLVLVCEQKVFRVTGQVMDAVNQGFWQRIVVDRLVGN